MPAGRLGASDIGDNSVRGESMVAKRGVLNRGYMKLFESLSVT